VGLQIILNIHQQDDLDFYDMPALNAVLMAHTSFGELYEEFTKLPGFIGPFERNELGQLRIAENWDGDFNGYGNNTMVWGCYGEDIWKQIASNLQQGKLVFHIDIEGNDDEYVIITPGHVEIKKESTIRF
jgi:hypothetical protein